MHETSGFFNKDDSLQTMMLKEVQASIEKLNGKNNSKILGKG